MCGGELKEKEIGKGKELEKRRYSLDLQR